MAVLGNNVNGGNVQGYSSDRKLVSQFTAGSSGTVTDGVVRMYAASTVNVPCRMVIYSDVAGAPSALLAVSDDTSFSSISEIAVAFTFSGSNQLAITSGTLYWVGVHYDYTSATVSVSRLNTAGLVRSNNDTFSDGAADPFGATATTAGPIDAYVNYTEASGSTGQMKVWNGSAFVAKPVKVWNGTSWVVKPVKYYNGTTWVTTPY